MVKQKIEARFARFAKKKTPQSAVALSLFFCFLLGDKVDDDPLPNEDVSGTDSQDGHSHKEYITINVTNSEGQLTNFTNG
jgi:hypothetical protein